ncbi:MAG: hypothetical protein ACFFBD_27765, partial [Candidatus Hodarchaeota archaeon]
DENEFADKLIHVIQKIQPNVEREAIMQEIGKITGKDETITQVILPWFEKYKSVLEEVDMDIKDMYSFLIKLPFFNEEKIKAFMKFAELLKLKPP